MQSIKDILKNFNPVKDKYVTRDFQAYGIELSEKLNDYKHRGLYIRLAKLYPRSVLSNALSFAIDSNAKNKGALFMWKLKQMGVFGKKKGKKVKQNTSVRKKKKI